ncbi:MAG: hypothetical protein KF842_15480 [Caulobacter sp.]|nr:hypothetical protein [Caulobacter sp.]
MKLTVEGYEPLEKEIDVAGGSKADLKLELTKKPEPPPPPPPPPPEGARTLVGTAAGETIEGDGRDELIQGLGGHDTLYGNGGNDRLEGGDGNDRLYGGDGDDVLVGGAGTDTLTGAAGADVFVMAPGSAGNTVTDFVQGEDLLDISAYGGYVRIAQLVSGARIVFADGAYLSLNGIQAADLTEADFITGAAAIPATEGGESIKDQGSHDEGWLLL